jgi:hypothetical protein
MHRAEVITVERRRRWSWTDKQQIVDETLMPGASISAVARRYGLHPSQVFAWRKAVREGDIEESGWGSLDCMFAPVVLTCGSRMPPPSGVAGLSGFTSCYPPVPGILWFRPRRSHSSVLTRALTRLPRAVAVTCRNTARSHGTTQAAALDRLRSISLLNVNGS